MFRFLFGRKDSQPRIVQETQRQTVERALSEINEVIAGMDRKPRITVEAGPGWLEIELPEQMPDEAKALPRPE